MTADLEPPCDGGDLALCHGGVAPVRSPGGETSLGAHYGGKGPSRPQAEAAQDPLPVKTNLASHGRVSAQSPHRAEAIPDHQHGERCLGCRHNGVLPAGMHPVHLPD